MNMHRSLLAGWGAAFAFAAGSIAVGCGPTYPNCDNDEHCHEGEYCVNGRCQRCRDDSHCPRGQQCRSGNCEPIPGWCDSDGACGPDEECVGNRCRRRIETTTSTTTTTTTTGPCQLQPVYFAFDDHNLDDTARRTLEANARCMQERDVRHVLITGMCDPRGTEEYNMALGDRRARSVRDHLQRLGIDRSRMTTRSVGEEQATGQDEVGWARDRRAEIAETDASRSGGGGRGHGRPR
jgi:peptidoglycan-associated lipoprotein